MLFISTQFTPCLLSKRRHHHDQPDPEEKSPGNRRFLKGVEIIGNKLPHPAILFFILSLIVIVVSHIAASQGMTVTYFDARAKAEVTKKPFPC